MEALTKKLYEALFLVDSALAAADWDGINKTIETILKKADAEIVSIRKWDERKLAYEIEHKSRGTYILCYFRADGQMIPQIERQVQLSEQIMRVLILCAEHQTQEDIEKDTPATAAEKHEQGTTQKMPPHRKEDAEDENDEYEDIEEATVSLIDTEPEEAKADEQTSPAEEDNQGSDEEERTEIV